MLFRVHSTKELTGFNLYSVNDYEQLIFANQEKTIDRTSRGLESVADTGDWKRRDALFVFTQFQFFASACFWLDYSLGTLHSHRYCGLLERAQSALDNAIHCLIQPNHPILGWRYSNAEILPIRMVLVCAISERLSICLEFAPSEFVPSQFFPQKRTGASTDLVREISGRNCPHGYSFRYCIALDIPSRTDIYAFHREPVFVCIY